MMEVLQYQESNHQDAADEEQGDREVRRFVVLMMKIDDIIRFDSIRFYLISV